MLSFIVIGKNIEKTISICLGSIFKFISFNKVELYEIIYVDSGSSDDSINLAKKSNVKIISLEGILNAAIARNIGAKFSIGEILFFIDGDMEILPELFSYVFINNTQSIRYPFLTGLMMEKYYDGDFNYIFYHEEIVRDKPVFEHVTGGLILIEKKLWQMVGGMDERLVRNQDVDFGLRISKQGIPILKDNHYWIIHHTTSYYDKSRLFSFLFNTALLSSGILMRKHLFYLKYLSNYKNIVFYVLLLSVTLLFVPFFPFVSLILFSVYILIQALRSIKNHQRGRYFLQSFWFKVFSNFYTLIGLFFYYPPKPMYRIISIE